MSILEVLVAAALTSIIGLALASLPIFSISAQFLNGIDRTKEHVFWSQRISRLLQSQATCTPSFTDQQLNVENGQIQFQKSYDLNKQFLLKDATGEILVKEGVTVPEGKIDHASLSIQSQLAKSYLALFEVIISDRRQAVLSSSSSASSELRQTKKSFLFEVVLDENFKITSCGAHSGTVPLTTVEGKFQMDLNTVGNPLPCIGLDASDLNLGKYPKGMRAQFTSILNCPKGQMPVASRYDMSPAYHLSYLIQPQIGQSPCAAQYDGPSAESSTAWQISLCCFYNGAVGMNASTETFNGASIVCQ